MSLLKYTYEVVNRRKNFIKNLARNPYSNSNGT